MDTLGVILAIAVSTAAGGLAGYYAAAARSAKLARVLAALLDSTTRERNIVRVRSRLARRPRRRYIVFEALPGGFREDDVRDAIESTAARLAGELGLALSGLALIEYRADTSRGVLRVRHEYKNLALAVLGLARSVGGQRALLVPIATTGSLKRARRLLQ
jgi:ribonuclease P/MRP protein subunit POP5